jgi:hypothetical protein
MNRVEFLDTAMGYHVMTYNCTCGYEWTTYWNKFSADMCVECEKIVEPNEKKSPQ